MRLGNVVTFAAGAAAGIAGAAGLRAASGLKRSMGAQVDTVYTNTDPDSPHQRFDAAKIARGVVGRARHGLGAPSGSIPLAADPSPEQASDLAVTWYGHSSVLIEVDVANRRIHLHVTDAELARRRKTWKALPPHADRGWVKLYCDTVLQADRGVDLDFLVGGSGAKVGRESH